MTTSDDTIPAFSQYGHGDAYEVYTFGTKSIDLRDYFAGQSNIVGDLSMLDKETGEALCGPYPDEAIEIFKWQVKVLATLRYIAADAMMEARK